MRKLLKRANKHRLDDAVLHLLETVKITLPDGTPWNLPDWMKNGVLNPLLTITPDSTPAYALAYLEGPKGIGKTFATLAVHLAEALAHPGSLIQIAGRDRGSVDVDKDFLSGMIARSPVLRRRCRVLADKIEIEGGSRFEFLASDEPGIHGAGGTHPQYRVILEDPFAWLSHTLLDSLLATSGKTPNSRVTLCTNPGPKRAGRLWSLRQSIKARHGRTAWYWAPWADGAKGPEVAWISSSWKAEMKDLLPPGVYARFVGGVWSEDGSFASREMIERCVGPHVTTWNGPGPEYAGLDIGLRRHFTALAWGHPSGGRFVLDGCTAWRPREQAGGEVVLEDVAEAVKRLAQGFPLAKILADPFQAFHLIQSLRGAVRIEEFPFALGNQMKLAQTFYEALSKGLIVLPTDLPDLVDEIADLDVVPSGFGFRFDYGGSEHGHGDRAVAVALAYYSAVTEGLQGRTRLICRVGGVRASAGGVGGRLAVGLGRRLSADDGLTDPRMAVIRADEPRKRWYDR